MIPWAHLSPQPKRHVDWLSHYCRTDCCDRLTDRPTVPSVKDFPSETPSHSAGLSIYFNWNFLLEFIDSVLVFSHTRILLHCGGVRIPKPNKKQNWVLEIQNRTEWNQNWKIQTNPPLNCEYGNKWDFVLLHHKSFVRCVSFCPHRQAVYIHFIHTSRWLGKPSLCWNSL